MRNTLSSESIAPWYGYSGVKFEGNEPFFFDEKDFTWVSRIEEQWLVIRNELEILLKEHGDSLMPYPNGSLSSTPDSWKTIGFYFWNKKFRKNCEKCPGIAALMESIPNMVSGSLSVLEPNSKINPHTGETNAIVRCHLGLVVPSGLPDCGIKVGTEERGWEEGKLLMFCDAHMHEAWNNTPHRRFVFIIDVIRPQYVSQINKICSDMLASIVITIVYFRLKFLSYLPFPIARLISKVIHKMAKIFLPFWRP